MAIFRGLNVFLYLGDVDNLADSLNNLGLNINDLNKIRGLSEFITTPELHLLGNLNDDQEKSTYSAYRSAFEMSSKVSSLVDIYQPSYDSNVIVNNQVRASAIKYNFLQYKEAAPYYETVQADISTSRVSSWSSLNTDNSNTIFYGAELSINPIDPNTGQNADPNDSIVFADSLVFKGPITEKRFEAEEPTTQIQLSINGQPYFFYAMQNIPLSFDAFFRNSELTFQTIAGVRPTLVILDNSFDPPIEYVFRDLLETTFEQEFNFTTNGSKRLDFYARPDAFFNLTLRNLNISSFPKATLPSLRVLDLTQNNFQNVPIDPPLETRTPALEDLIFAGNPLSTSVIPANSQINLLGVSNLKLLDISGTFTNSGLLDLSSYQSLLNFKFNSSWSRGNIRRNTFSGATPRIGTSLLTYRVQDQSYRFLSTSLLEINKSIQIIDLFNNNLIGMKEEGEVTSIDPVIIGNPTDTAITEIILDQNSIEPICFGAPIPSNTAYTSVASQTIVTYSHNKNFNGAKIDIGSVQLFQSTDPDDPVDPVHGYFEDCRSLRFVDFSDSYVTGRFDLAFKNCPSLEELDLSNTRINGTFQPLAIAGEIRIEAELTGTADEDEDYIVAIQNLASSLATFKLSGGTFDTTVDTANNFFGNEIDPIITDFGEAFYSAATLINPSRDSVTFRKSLNATDYPNYTQTPTAEGNEDSIVTDNLYATNLGINVGNVEPFNDVAANVKGNFFTDASQGRFAICSVQTDYYENSRSGGFTPSNGWNYTVEGACVLYNSNGGAVRRLEASENYIPERGERGGLFGGYQVNHTEFGASVAMNDDFVFVGFPGAYISRFIQAGTVSIHRRGNGSELPSDRNGLREPSGLTNASHYGSDIVCDNQFIWVLDDAERIIRKFRSETGFVDRGRVLTADIIDERNITPFRSRTRLSKIKQNENYIVMGAKGATVGANTLPGVVFVINKANDSVTKIFPGTTSAPNQALYEENFGGSVDIATLSDGNTVIAISSNVENPGVGFTEGYGSTVELYNLNGTFLNSLGFETDTGTAPEGRALYASHLNFYTFRETEGALLTTYLSHEIDNTVRTYEITSAGYSNIVSTASNSIAEGGSDIYQFDGSDPVFEDFEEPFTSKAFAMLPALDSFSTGGTRSIEGKLPDMQYFNVLRTFELYGTNMSGPVDFNQLQRSSVIRIQDNQFSGGFPATSLPDLTILDISRNKFTSIGQLTLPSIQFFNCSTNVLGGTIPSFSQSVFLKELNMSANQFNAYESDSLSTCLSIRKVDFSNNSLTLQDAFRILDDMETNYNNNNRSGVTVNLLGNTLISEVQISQNATYLSKLIFLREIAGWLILIN